MKKGYFQNFSWFQYFVNKLRMITCIDIAPYTTVLIKFSDTREFMGKLHFFHRNDITQFLWRNVFLREGL